MPRQKRKEKPNKDELIRIQAWANQELIDKIDLYADKLGKTRNEMTILLLEAAVEDNEIPIKIAEFFKKSMEMVQKQWSTGKSI